jgi:hypothetical protein
MKRVLAKYWRGAAASVACVVLWSFLADRTPTSTFHFAPVLVAAAWVAVEGTTGAGLAARATVKLAAAGVVVAAAATVGLEMADLLRGPVFWQHGPDAPVVAEHLLFALIGGLIGALISVRYASGTPASAGPSTAG